MTNTYLERCDGTSTHCHGGPLQSTPVQVAAVKNPTKSNTSKKKRLRNFYSSSKKLPS